MEAWPGRRTCRASAARTPIAPGMAFGDTAIFLLGCPDVEGTGRVRAGRATVAGDGGGPGRPRLDDAGMDHDACRSRRLRHHPEFGPVEADEDPLLPLADQLVDHLGHAVGDRDAGVA